MAGQELGVGGRPTGARERSARPLVLRVALLASISTVLLGVVAGCVQSPVANSAPYSLTDGSTSQAYTPDTVPMGVPALGSAPDVSTPSGDESAPAPTSDDPKAVPTMEVPAATKAAATAAPGEAATQAVAVQPQATQAATTAAPLTVAPTTASPTVSQTTTAALAPALVGPGQVELKCTHTTEGRTKAVLKWTNPGFNASVTVNGRTTYLSTTSSTSLTAYAIETTANHGICTGRVGDSTAANSY